MKIKSPYILYSLPKSRTTQAFNRNKIDRVLKDIQLFLENCTTSHISNPETIQLTAYTAFDSNDPSDFLDALIDKTIGKFGDAEISPIAYQYPSGVPDTTNKYEWTLSTQKLQEAIQYIIDSSPMPKSTFGPLELLLNYNFKLISPDSGQELPNQEHTSSFMIWVSRRNACSPHLFFPFTFAGNDFYNYLESITNFLPFKLEEKYLRIANINKLGEVKSFKRINPR